MDYERNGSAQVMEFLRGLPMPPTWEAEVLNLAQFGVLSHIRCQAIGSSDAPAILSQVTCHAR